MRENNAYIWCVTFHCPEWHSWVLQECDSEAGARAYAERRCGSAIPYEIKQYTRAQVDAIHAFHLEIGKVQKPGTPPISRGG